MQNIWRLFAKNLKTRIYIHHSSITGVHEKKKVKIGCNMCGHIAQFHKILQKRVTLEIFRHNLLTVSNITESNHLLNRHIWIVHDSWRGKTLQNVWRLFAKNFKPESLKVITQLLTVFMRKKSENWV